MPIDEDVRARIRQRAHELWEAEGRPAGRELQHWLEAEREIVELSVAGEEDPLAGLDDWRPGDLKAGPASRR